MASCFAPCSVSNVAYCLASCSGSGAATCCASSCIASNAAAYATEGLWRRVRRLPTIQCPKCPLRVYVLAPRLRETSPPKGITFSSPDCSSTHTMSARAFIMGVRELIHRGHGNPYLALTKVRLVLRYVDTSGRRITFRLCVILHR